MQVAHRIGAEDFAGARKILRQSVTATLIFSSLLAVTGITISDMLPSWLVGDADYGCHGSFDILDIELCFHRVKDIRISTSTEIDKIAII